MNSFELIFGLAVVGVMAYFVFRYFNNQDGGKE